MTFDPANLLRQTWTDPDALARELYVMLRELKAELPPPSAPTSRGPVGVGRVSTLRPYSDEAALVRLRPTPSIMQQAISSPSSVGSTRPPETARLQLPGIPTHQPANTPPAPYQYQSPGQDRLAPRSVQADLEVSEPVLPRPENAAPSFERPFSPPPIGTNQTNTASPEIRERTQRATDTPSPGAFPPTRGSFDQAPPITVAQVARIVTPPPELRVAQDPTVVATQATRTQAADVPHLQPFQLQTPDRPSQGVSDLAQADETFDGDPIPAEVRTLQDFPRGDGTLWLLYLEPAGIPGCRTAASGTPPTVTPGKGQGTLYGFDPGEGLTQADGELITVYNYGVFPISGSQTWPVRGMYDYWFAQPASSCHGVIAAQANPVTGTTPDTSGSVTLYYRRNGVLTIDQTVLLECWYTVTAAVGKHCGVQLLDAMVSLEVLDC